MSDIAISPEDLRDPEVLAHLSKLIDDEILAEALEAEREQTAIAQMHRRQPNLRAIDGLGPQVLEMSQTAFLHYKNEEKFDFSSKKDRAWLLNRHPEMVVTSGQKVKPISEGWTPALETEDRGQKSEVSPAPRNVRETITYPPRC